MPATFRMTSFGLVQPDSLPVSLTPITLGCVRVCANHEEAGESVVLKDDLVDDAAAWFPETDAILGSRCGKEVVNLFVDIFCSCQIRIALNLSLDQMVAVDGAGHGNFGKAGADELKHRHLGCSILHSNPVWSQSQVALPPDNVLA